MLPPDTYPVLGLGGVKGTGRSPSFTQGGFACGNGGVMPLGAFDNNSVPAPRAAPVSGRIFFTAPADPATDVSDVGGGKSVDVSPKTDVGADFNGERAAEQPTL